MGDAAADAAPELGDAIACVGRNEESQCVRLADDTCENACGCDDWLIYRAVCAAQCDPVQKTLHYCTSGGRAGVECIAELATGDLYTYSGGFVDDPENWRICTSDEFDRALAAHVAY